MQPTQFDPTNPTAATGSFAQNVLNNSAAMNLANNNQAAQQAQTPKDSGNWFTHLLPTIGSVAAPVIGGLLAPATGGLSLLAGAALSGLGGAGGKVIENVAENKAPLDQDVLNEGLINGVAGGAGGLLGKFGAKVAKNFVAPMAEKAGTSLVAGQGAGALTNQDANYLFKNGVTNLKQMGNIAPTVTQGNGAFSNAVTNSLHNAADAGTRIDLSSLGAQAKGLPGDTVLNAVRDAGISGDSNSVKSVQEFVQGQLEKYNKGGITTVPAPKGGRISSFDNGVLNAQHPVDALNMTQAMDKTANTWLKSSSPNIQAQGRALQNISSTIKDGLYGPDSAIAKTGLSDQVKQQALADLEPLKAINPQYHAAKVNELNNAQTIADLRSAQAPDVRSSIALNSAEHAADTNGGNKVTDILPMGGGAAGFGIGGIPGGIAGYAAGKALESNPAQVAGASLLSKLSKAAGSSTAQKVIPTVARAGTVAAANLPTMGAGATSRQGQPTLGDTMQNGQTPGQPGQPTQYDNLVNAMMAQSVLAPTLAGSSGANSFLSSLAPKLQAQQTLRDMLGGLQTSYENAGGAQGIGGVGSVLSGLVPGTNANAYNTQAAAAAAQLANTLGISKEEAMGMLPQLMSTGTGYGDKVNNLNSILGSFAGRGAVPSAV